jgi:flagellar hook-associated protein 3 FlgL
MNAISTQTLNTFTLRAAMQNQADYAQLEEQEASGLASQTLGGLGTGAGTLLNLQDQLSKAQNYKTEATAAGNKVQTMYTAIGDMTTELTSIETTLSSAIEGTSSGLTTSSINTTGSEALTALAGYMNSQYGTDYLFGGTNTGTAPVDLTGYAPSSPTTTADTSYYQGNDTTLSIQVSAQQTLSYGVTGDNTAFEQALRAAYTLSTATISDTTTLKAALTLTQNAITALSTLQQNVSLSASTLTTAADNQASAITYLTTSVSDIKSVDTASVTAQVSQEQTLLTASFDAIAKVAKISLSNYL